MTGRIGRLGKAKRAQQNAWCYPVISGRGNMLFGVGYFRQRHKGHCRKGKNRVLRGGSYFNNAENCRCANRNDNHPENRNDNNGFRLALPSSSQERPDGFH